MKLNQIADNHGAHKKRRRIGRGIGSGRGKTASHGQKGQKARTGVALAGFEGGQMPLHRRMPKRGFKNLFRRDTQPVNLWLIQKGIDSGKIDTGKTVTEKSLVESKVLRRARDGIRLLGKGEIKAKVTIEVAGASKSAIAAVEKAGGKVVVEKPKTPKAKAAKSKEPAEPKAS